MIRSKYFLFVDQRIDQQIASLNHRLEFGQTIPIPANRWIELKINVYIGKLNIYFKKQRKITAVRYSELIIVDIQLMKYLGIVILLLILFGIFFGKYQQYSNTYHGLSAIEEIERNQSQTVPENYPAIFIYTYFPLSISNGKFIVVEYSFKYCMINF